MKASTMKPLKQDIGEISVFSSQPVYLPAMQRKVARQMPIYYASDLRNTDVITWYGIIARDALEQGSAQFAVATRNGEFCLIATACLKREYYVSLPRIYLV